ncbi:PadR family transcriptional regulator [Sphingomonas floccifaciens]|uniref:PadR family transcriptional regulator n=1 Tax=Sphingomonas floccifaciens TaxID=1844115 RepID=A0ABW4NG42_9SPHN
MHDPDGPLTELEGAILSEIHHRGADTAFKVRRAFQNSPSHEWSGSAGAVYPAIRRLTGHGLIAADTSSTGRRTSILTLTEKGSVKLNEWISDVDRAASLGLDPFRLRSGLWDHLPPQQRLLGLKALFTKIERQLEELAAYKATLDTVEQRRIDLSIDLQRLRLAWIDDEMAHSIDR